LLDSVSATLILQTHLQRISWYYRYMPTGLQS
jgi:hypothetical protein